MPYTKPKTTLQRLSRAAYIFAHDDSRKWHEMHARAREPSVLCPYCLLERVACEFKDLQAKR